MLIAYTLLIGLLFVVVGPWLLIAVFLTGRHRPLIHERLGWYPSLPVKEEGRVRFWLHGASVGEVKAAVVLIDQLRRLVPGAEFVVTTMTVTGRNVARELLGKDVRCLLTPLDVPLIVHRVVGAIDPDGYVCLETELWPVLLHTLTRRGIPLFLANGRMSASSCRGYGRVKWFFSRVINLFTHMAFITERDRERYLRLGGDPAKMSVEGNVKYDLPATTGLDDVRNRHLATLQLAENQEILIGGSTHKGEEEMLVTLRQQLIDEHDLLLILAPRHIERLAEIEAMLNRRGETFHRFSELVSGAPRTRPIILLDSLGELSQLYSIGTYIFCGGSLVEYGGHNVMEAAAWQKPVFYGPHMADFRDAVDLLQSADAGFLVSGIQEMKQKIRFFRTHPHAYQQACESAGTVAAAQQGSAKRQAGVIIQKKSMGIHRLGD